MISGTSLKSKRFETNQVYLQQRRFIAVVLWSHCYKVCLYDIKISNRNGWFNLFTKVFKYFSGFWTKLDNYYQSIIRKHFLNQSVSWCRMGDYTLINSYPGFYRGWYRPDQEDYGLFEDVSINYKIVDKNVLFNLKDKWTQWWL